MKKQGIPETPAETDVLAQVEETVASRYGLQIREIEREHEYNLLKVEADTKIKGQAMQESFSRLMRTMFLRQTKDRLKRMVYGPGFARTRGSTSRKRTMKSTSSGTFATRCF